MAEYSSDIEDAAMVASSEKKKFAILYDPFILYYRRSSKMAKIIVAVKDCEG